MKVTVSSNVIKEKSRFMPYILFMFLGLIGIKRWMNREGFVQLNYTPPKWATASVEYDYKLRSEVKHDTARQRHQDKRNRKGNTPAGL